jgi:RNA 2',3'-cyclic 3'-phosphodiesterase
MRTFIAVDISNKNAIENLQQELSDAAGWRANEVRAVKKENLHFTVIFLNEVDPVTIEKIKNKLSEINFEPIKISFSSVGGFPSSNLANVIWVGVDEEGKRKLISLAESVTSKMKDIGFTPDKQFTPHMTIFRIKRRKLRLDQILTTYSAKTFGDDTIEKLCLKVSTITRHGPSYSNIFTVHAK